MEECNVLHAFKRRKVNRTGHICRTNCFVKHFIEGKIEGSRRRERRRKQLLGVIQETERHWKLKQEALESTVWENVFWKRLWTCRKTDYMTTTTTTTTMMMMMMMTMMMMMMIYYL